MKLSTISQKIKSLEDCLIWLNEKANSEKKVVFTNGCFDILHLGHISYLAGARDLGDLLVVGVNADESVRRLGKDVNRPINPENARALILAALEFVDCVIIFNEDTPLELIETLKPHVLVKGGDYSPIESDPSSPQYIVGREVILKNGGEVKIIKLVAGFSTTTILAKGSSSQA